MWPGTGWPLKFFIVKKTFIVLLSAAILIGTISYIAQLKKEAKKWKEDYYEDFYLKFLALHVQTSDSTLVQSMSMSRIDSIKVQDNKIIFFYNNLYTPYYNDTFSLKYNNTIYVY